MVEHGERIGENKKADHGAAKREERW